MMQQTLIFLSINPFSWGLHPGSTDSFKMLSQS